MKKLLALILAPLALTALLSGCRADGTQQQTDTTTQVTEQTVGRTQNLISGQDGAYSITLPGSGKVIVLDEQYLKYLPYITDELIEQAEKKTDKLLKYDVNFARWFTVDSDGYLYLSGEGIIMINSFEAAAKIEAGMDPDIYVDKGCAELADYESGGSNHYHLFCHARISTKAISD